MFQIVEDSLYRQLLTVGDYIITKWKVWDKGTISMLIMHIEVGLEPLSQLAWEIVLSDNKEGGEMGSPNFRPCEDEKKPHKLPFESTYNWYFDMNRLVLSIY